MMLKMLNPLGGMPAVPGGEEREESGLSREELQEQERLRSVFQYLAFIATADVCRWLLLFESVENNLLLFHLMC